ncbi:multidrug resistance protein 1-like isoform X2 [Centruroides sculpturatus]|uniref:multidrug resistance protein 1-like isoform X1 n=1 Tax=Centruroides sculpturatus TaxID=218467 RepID=UPI000C6D977A|nr:multidrug resistance protein 1-like isoform X1 [Centruroides sculpturatus]XP_023237035.1 multidrug resistance protein 1-like isoform X1 [Centruroides sculpturatus]XP_023237036.1 multidrug resistance protein 1-like isoform X1 [Centruroides sculpturatus]XP_023237037.1 multidrug resistance protein 1-like isoform X1 [Centruroides sculpturatus]XP_023237038.1 multidrug resistance protein 1-like isoform X1 [Centruroides sculpturatus]XP_023237039.1 multidrug resistance protein 1-like isoform X2 [Ce
MSKEEFIIGTHFRSLNGDSSDNVEGAKEQILNVNNLLKRNKLRSTESKLEKFVKQRSKNLQISSLLSLYKYATPFERVLIFIGCILAVISGVSYPAMVLFIGWLIDEFVDKEINGKISIENTTIPQIFYNNTNNEFLETCKDLSIKGTLVAVFLFLLNYTMVTCFSFTAERQIFRIKCLFMKSILRQDIGWFDTHQTGDFSSRVTIDLDRIREGIGEKVCICIYFMSTTILSFICALAIGWKLTLVIMSVMPILIVSAAVISKIQAKSSMSELSAYGKAGAVAEEVLSSIRTVVSFGGERKEIDRYEKNLIYAKKNGIKRGLATSVGSCLVWFTIYSSYALAFWYGTELIIKSHESNSKEYKPSTLIIVFFNVLQAAIYMGEAIPYFEAFAMARGAATNIFNIISRVPHIDSFSETGEKPKNLIGNVQFKNVCFRYPARFDVPVLNGLILEGKAGQTIALVGSSGCGKSTVIQLLQRFYDPLSGQILLDGKEIGTYNLGWLRKQIGVVGQEPVLFSSSIAENIRHGYPQATDEEIQNAAKAANAHDFISKLPKRYETVVGERGTQLSGGQKQRIAIARALVRNPKILLLDEATSALDTESESIVQQALDQARKGRTTFVVAHRLSTVRTADKIICINKGVVAEVGTHTELMKQKGLYYQMVIKQNLETEESIENFEEQPTTKLNLTRNISTISNGSTNLKSEISPVPPQINDTNDDENINNKRLIKVAAQEWPYLLTGCACSLIMGLSVPIYGIIIGDVIQMLSSTDKAQIRKDTIWYSTLFMIMAVITAIAAFLQSLMFTIAGERLTMKLRKNVFAVMVRQHIGWFDETQNNTGALCSKLSSDASQIQGATGSRLATLNQALATMIASVVIGIYYNWKIGLVVLSFVPLVLLATYLESRIISGHLLREKKSTESATKISVEAIENIRTVTSLHQQESFYNSYVTFLSESSRRKFKTRCFARGLTFGFAQSIPSFAYSIAMYYGSILMVEDDLKFGDLFKITESIILGTMMMAEAVSFAPNYQKAKAATNRIFKLLDIKSKVDSFCQAGLKQVSTSGCIQFKNLFFNYPTRSEVKVLEGLDLTVSSGQTVALVGSSGCGKSTCIQLLERFYDALNGEVLVDGINIENLNVSWLRSQIGLVSQEPVLFGYSIAENIAYGDNSRQVTMDEIIEAARKANIHNFIASLPAGYDTSVGDRGTQLSGGQKQRIAIARALVRKPKILLLDEATSALDTESEKIVQDALDQARVGRTCIVIAHRLSTIQNADQIVVIQKGKVVEKGTHNSLLSKKGLYHKLCAFQSGKLSDS